MKVFVTGASGFIGSALCRRLVLENYAVHGLVRSAQAGISGVTYHKGALDVPAALESAVEGAGAVVHLAGLAHVFAKDSPDALASFRTINYEATLGLARLAVRAGVKRFIFISSVGVNGSQTTSLPFNEESAVKPHAGYALSKLEAEEGLKSLLDGTETELVIIRPPLVYDVSAPGNFARLLKLVASGLPLPFGGVQNQRSILLLDNLILFIRLCIDHPAAANQLFLLSDGQDLSTVDMVKGLATGMGKSPLLVPFPDIFLKRGASLLGRSNLYTQLFCSLQIDSTKARALLGWAPAANTYDNLRQIGEAYRTRVGKLNSFADKG